MPSRLQDPSTCRQDPFALRYQRPRIVGPILLIDVADGTLRRLQLFPLLLLKDRDGVDTDGVRVADDGVVQLAPLSSQ